MLNHVKFAYSSFNTCSAGDITLEPNDDDRTEDKETKPHSDGLKSTVTTVITVLILVLTLLMCLCCPTNQTR